MEREEAPTQIPTAFDFVNEANQFIDARRTKATETDG